MTDNTHNNNEAPAMNDLITQAISALTSAARQTRVIGPGTSNEHLEPVDFGEIACHVLTAVAANIGDVEQLLSGRPGSWEADHVRQIVRSTAGEDPSELLHWRTEPVRLVLDVEDTFDDFGIVTQYMDDTDALIDVENEADEALFEAVATTDERERLAEIQAAMAQMVGIEGTDPDRTLALWGDAASISQRVLDRATETEHPLLAPLLEARQSREAVDALWEQDQAAYLAAYAATARHVLSERGARVNLEMLISTPGTSGPNDTPEWNDLTDELHQIARESTPLPMTGQVPDWTDGTPADALRRAGRTYADRATSGKGAKR